MRLALPRDLRGPLLLLIAAAVSCGARTEDPARGMAGSGGTSGGAAGSGGAGTGSDGPGCGAFVYLQWGTSRDPFTNGGLVTETSTIDSCDVFGH